MIVLLLLAVALATDAFAVAIAQGATARPDIVRAARLGLVFGGAQAVMPLLGWRLGVAFAGLIDAVDHWIAFALLAGLGAKMIREGMARVPHRPPAPFAGSTLLTAALATSIDAAATGLTLPTLGLPIALSCATIGIVTGLLCFAGALGGARIGTRFGKQAEIVGGLVLVAIGAAILARHVGWIG